MKSDKHDNGRSSNVKIHIEQDLDL
jgi:hypothetical protein